jgi:hypothetical protein
MFKHKESVERFKHKESVESYVWKPTQNRYTPLDAHPLL